MPRLGRPPGWPSRGLAPVRDGASLKTERKDIWTRRVRRKRILSSRLMKGIERSKSRAKKSKKTSSQRYVKYLKSLLRGKAKKFRNKNLKLRKRIQK